MLIHKSDRTKNSAYFKIAIAHTPLSILKRAIALRYTGNLGGDRSLDNIIYFKCRETLSPC
ncbi:hypothetical protein IQ259_20655 [Fortiea sp. LEGE XX443]|uniref:hypothetical protein n=1 Tax=Fortiea sp. LEGE XX443 TaxID=1828611 RepID=UPI00187FB0B5|nr:hypothetical protein [Fortiea sp. LEGE XX443]MBE9007410.1 hypothetical protein [Fortiea sp. LEGE XX443]